jgi:hypothetical protein
MDFLRMMEGRLVNLTLTSPPSHVSTGHGLLPRTMRVYSAPKLLQFTQERE